MAPSLHRGAVRLLRSSLIPLLCLALAACGGSTERGGHTPHRANAYIPESTSTALPGHLRPRMVNASSRLQCVPYAREQSGIQIRGDAWTWWDQAAGRYARGQRPEVGSVLVLRRRGGSLGHVGVVSEIIDGRTIVLRHANWLNGGRIHIDTPVRDTSSAGDWSAVRVWYTPGGVYGGSTYPAYGFIYPRTVTARS